MDGGREGRGEKDKMRQREAQQLTIVIGRRGERVGIFRSVLREG